MLHIKTGHRFFFPLMTVQNNRCSGKPYSRIHMKQIIKALVFCDEISLVSDAIIQKGI